MNPVGDHHDDPAQPGTATGSRVAAFFDLDKTIIATSSAFAYGREFYNNGLITSHDAWQISLAKASYMMSGQSSEQMDSTKEQLTAMVSGWPVDQVREIVRETMHSVLTPAIYTEARELIQDHQRAGHEVVIVSASASHLVEPIAQELGIKRIIATELEVVDGLFTGNVEFFCKGPAKAAAMTTLADTHGIDLKDSFAYSDSATDLPMLELVGHPVAVNPDRVMKKAALERGWTIRTFKDPVPLFQLPGAREVGIGAGLVAGIAALITAGAFLSKYYSSDTGRAELKKLESWFKRSSA